MDAKRTKNDQDVVNGQRAGDAHDPRDAAMVAKVRTHMEDMYARFSDGRESSAKLTARYLTTYLNDMQPGTSLPTFVIASETVYFQDVAYAQKMLSRDTRAASEQAQREVFARMVLDAAGLVSPLWGLMCEAELEIDGRKSLRFRLTFDPVSE